MKKKTIAIIVCIVLAVIIIGGPIYKRLIKGSDEDDDLDVPDELEEAELL